MMENRIKISVDKLNLYYGENHGLKKISMVESMKAVE